MNRLLPLTALLMLALAACTSRGLTPSDLPTVAPLDESGVTAVALTQNAPPEGFREFVAFPEVDQNLRNLPGWHYLVQLEFDGTVARTDREGNAEASAEVWFNQFASSRRVVVETAGELIGQTENTVYEAVRLGPDAFLVRNGVCLGNTGGDAETAADLRAGLLVGGVQRATPTGVTATLNGEEAWQYRFDYEDLILPNIRLAEDGRVFFTNGELWVAPEHNAVVRFYVTIELENAFIFDRQLPVTGKVIMRYDLLDVGEVPNINVPFGC